MNNRDMSNHFIQVSVYICSLSQNYTLQLVFSAFSALKYEEYKGKKNNAFFDLFVFNVVLGSPIDGSLNALCSWEKHFTFTAPLSTQVYK